VVDGELALWLDGGALIRGPGSYVLMRAGRPQTFWNPSDRPATYLTVMSPAGAELPRRPCERPCASGHRRGRGRSPESTRARRTASRSWDDRRARPDAGQRPLSVPPMALARAAAV